MNILILYQGVPLGTTLGPLFMLLDDAFLLFLVQNIRIDIFSSELEM